MTDTLDLSDALALAAKLRERGKQADAEGLYYDANMLPAATTIESLCERLTKTDAALRELELGEPLVRMRETQALNYMKFVQETARAAREEIRRK
jgi:hypothetical protein